MSKKYIKIIFTFTILFVFAVILNEFVFPKYGHKLVYDSGHLKLIEYKSYSKMESKILKILISDTSVLGEIPQFEYLLGKTGFANEELERCLNALVEKDDISINADGIIINAYPWTLHDNDFKIFLIGGKEPASDFIPAASALHAFSVSSLLGSNIQIKSRLKDTGESLTIDIADGQIETVSHLAAVVYRDDNFANSNFYSSIKGVEKDIGNDFNVNGVLRLDRALKVGNYIADELRKKIE